jgi:hypothetical protein
MLDEIDENFERLAAEWNLVIAAPQEAALDIEREVAEAVLAGQPFFWLRLGAAHADLLAGSLPKVSYSIRTISSRDHDFERPVLSLSPDFPLRHPRRNVMTQQRSRLMSVMRIGCAIAVLASLLPGSALAADDRDRDETTLVGTWRETVIFPGVPIEFSDLIAFHEDGTVTERFGSGPPLSTGIGVWKRIGRGAFAVTFENFEDTDHDGTFDVRYRIRATYRVVDRNTLTATATSDTLSVDGTIALASFPGATVRATRMPVVRE